MPRLLMDLKVGESLKIGDYATITLESKSGKMARLSIQADKSVSVSRDQPPSAAQLAASVGISGKS